MTEQQLLKTAVQIIFDHWRDRIGRELAEAAAKEFIKNDAIVRVAMARVYGA